MKRTALYPLHAALHAKLGSFGGWELPLYYSSILEEHRAVRTAVGIFDVSHLGHLEVSGPGALSKLQPLVTQDINRLEVGRALYTPMLNPQGGILDEMIFYRLEPMHRLESDRFRLVVNAANGDKVLGWLKSRLGSHILIEDLRERVGTLAVQGPKAVALVSRLAQMGTDGDSPAGDTLLCRVSPDRAVPGGVSPSGTSPIPPRYSIGAGEIAGRKILFARTGYTGEDGFELFVKTEDLGEIWKRVLEAGQPDQIRPVGLGARDTLRLEAGLPLGGSDLDDTTTPLEAGLDWTIGWEKGPFVGREVLERQRKEGISRRLIGFRLKEAGIPRHGYRILQEGRPVGQVTSGTFLPAGCSGQGTEAQGIGLGYVPPALDRPGSPISVEIHGRSVPAEVVKLPFYRRRS